METYQFFKVFKGIEIEQEKEFKLLDQKTLHRFLHLGDYVRGAHLPINDPGFQFSWGENGKWSANMVIFGNPLPLFELTTYIFLDSQGVKFSPANLDRLIRHNQIYCLKFLLKLGVLPTEEQYNAVLDASDQGFREMIKILLEVDWSFPFINVLYNCVYRKHRSIMKLVLRKANGLIDERQIYNVAQTAFGENDEKSLKILLFYLSDNSPEYQKLFQKK